MYFPARELEASSYTQTAIHFMTLGVVLAAIA